MLRGMMREFLDADVANMTPVQALFRLNEWQRQLKDEG
jgi:hypothetical protein